MGVDGGNKHQGWFHVDHNLGNTQDWKCGSVVEHLSKAKVPEE